MACNTKPGPARCIAAYEAATGTKITQADWHDIRVGAAIEAGATKLSRQRVPADEARSRAARLATDMNLGYEGDPEWEKFVADIEATDMTEGTFQAMDYLVRRVRLDELNTPRNQREAKGYLGTPWAFPGPNASAEELANFQQRAANEAADLSDKELIEAIDALDKELDELPATYSERNAAEQMVWKNRYNRMVGLTGVAMDRGLIGHDGYPAGAAEEYAAVAAEVAVESDTPPAAPAARFVGSKYTGWRDGADIAKDIRADIKAAVKQGDLPKDVKVSVRTHKYGGGQAVDVHLSGWPQERIMVPDAMYGGRYTDEARAILNKVEQMREAYNRDDSDSMTDYFNATYYGTTSWDY